MPSCLGIYIEDKIIKYAKVSKNKDTIKVEAFGIEFYENLAASIRKIVEETNSSKVPISINTKDEWYNNIQVFSLLSEKDRKTSIQTEFENICYSREINQNVYEQKYVITNSNVGDDRLNAIHISVPKTSLEERKNQLLNYKISNMSPISVCIGNLIKKEKKGTSLIVNIEKNTIITKVINGVISDVKVINIGANTILENINKRENSFSKSYEVCKNSTIYTENDTNTKYEENEYLEDIMPTLFQIVSEVRKYIDENIEQVEKIYITGTGSVINNIELYFQDNLKNIHCEVLKPNFLSNNSRINLKDYIEVNSAISIGVQGLETKNTDINFKINSSAKNFSNILTADISDIKGAELLKSVGNVFGRFNRQLDFLSSICIIATILYFCGSCIINNEFDKKISEAETSISKTNQEIQKIQNYNKKLDSQRAEYVSLIKSIEEINNENTEDKRYRNTIPNLLNHIMSTIPKGVQLDSITNTSDSHIVIVARAYEMQQIAYFKTKLKTEDILENVVSDPGKSSDGYIVVTIEGELP